MTIIEGRLEKALRVKNTKPSKQQARLKTLRRGTYTKGVRTMTKHVTLDMPEDLYRRLMGTCETLRMSKAVLIRQSVEFYIGMAEQEGLGAKDANKPG